MANNSYNQDVILMGKHCTFPSCNRLDFLPFSCTKCSGTFCIDHRREQDHKCPNSSMGNTEIPECPKCGQLIKRTHNQTANDQVERHLMSGCKDYILHTTGKPKHHHKCTYKRCKQYELVSFICPTCGKNYCIKHRLATVHNCTSNNSMLIVAH